MKKCPTCGKQYEDTNTLCPSDGSVLKKTGEDALIGQLLAGKYRIEEKIDEGGMGCVYRATHILMEKTLAIKVLHPALAADDKIVARFTREAKAASRISHPHALTVTDFGESDNGVVFLVMEYLRGRTLKDIIRGDGPMSLPRVTEIVRQVSGALEAAHEQGVVHRDLKSDNIMLEETSGGDWTKVLDFGIAKIQESTGDIDPGLTAPNLIIGTPQYMSPEQCSQASDIDQRSDIYSFGIILYEMLVGHVPFTGDSPTAIMMKHLQEPAPSVLEERGDLPPGVGEVIARALAKNPAHRFQKAGELSDAFALAASKQSSAALLGDSANETDRITATTAPNEAPRTTFNADADEVTVVRGASGYERRTLEEEEALPPYVASAPVPSFNPWRIALPAIAAVAVIFAIVYAVQQRTPAEGEQNPLSSDPNSQPVQSISPPTGQAESNLAPAPGTTPQPSGTGESGGLPASDGGNVNTGETASPSPAAEGPERDANRNTNQSAEEEEEPEATPTPSNRNTNRRLPAINANVDAEPPPAPTPAKKNPPAPEVPPSDAPATDDSPQLLKPRR
jgi:serine/threonine-protein kinase